MDRNSKPILVRRILRCPRWVVGIACVYFYFTQVQAQEIPSVGQPKSHFYNAQGNRVRVEWVLDRTTVPEDENIVATLVISGVTNPREVIRPDLLKLEEFESRFIIPVDFGARPPAADAKEVRFIYRLRPRNRSVDRVPTLQFHYHNPAATKEKWFPLTTAREVRITVTAPRPKVEAPATPLAEPEWLLTYVPRPVSLSRSPFSGVWLWLAIALGGPLAALVWFAARRRIYPDGTRLARMRRSRAARRAFDSIRHANRAPDPPSAVSTAVLGYLRARFPLAPAATTPTEIGSALGDLGLPGSEVETVVGFFRNCDAERFALTGDEHGSLAADAAALIRRLEEA